MQKSIETVTEIVNYARHEPHHCLTPGLFKSYKKGDRKNLKLYARYEISPDGKQYIEFKGYEPLGVDDLRVLQGLVAMSGPYGVILEPEPVDPISNQLRIQLETDFDAKNENARVAKGSLGQLCKLIGYTPGGSANRRIMASIERLHLVGVTMVIEESGRIIKRASHIISYALSDTSSDYSEGKIKVALNPMLARSVVGESRYVKINLEEVRNLNTDAAILIHQRLCGWIDIGKTRSVGMDKLFEYVWHTSKEAITPRTLKYRRKVIRQAISELQSIGWNVSETKKKGQIIFQIERNNAEKHSEYGVAYHCPSKVI
jgi:hypothetical protein